MSSSTVYFVIGDVQKPQRTVQVRIQSNHRTFPFKKDAGSIATTRIADMCVDALGGAAHAERLVFGGERNLRLAIHHNAQRIKVAKNVKMYAVAVFVQAATRTTSKDADAPNWFAYDKALNTPSVVVKSVSDEASRKALELATERQTAIKRKRKHAGSKKKRSQSSNAIAGGRRIDARTCEEFIRALRSDPSLRAEMKEAMSRDA